MCCKFACSIQNYAFWSRKQEPLLKENQGSRVVKFNRKKNVTRAQSNFQINLQMSGIFGKKMLN